MQDVQPQDAPWLGRMMTLAPRLAQENGCTPGPDGGFRLVVNTGIEGGQEIAHLHFHIIGGPRPWRSEEHTSELQSLMRISYAVFCLKKKKKKHNHHK